MERLTGKVQRLILRLAINLTRAEGMFCLKEKEGIIVLPRCDHPKKLLLCFVAMTIVVRKKCLECGYSDEDIDLTGIVSKIVETDERGEHRE